MVLAISLVPLIIPAKTSSAGPAAPVALDSEEQRMVDLINAWRADPKNGAGVLPPLKVSPTLTAAAKFHSQDMADRNYFEHATRAGPNNNPPYQDCFERIKSFGYNYPYASAGENIAGSNATAEATFQQWKDSPPHNANMLGGDPSWPESWKWKVIGIGRAYNANSDWGWYWTADFGNYDDSGYTPAPTPTSTPAPTPGIVNYNVGWQLVGGPGGTSFYPVNLYSISSLRDGLQGNTGFIASNNIGYGAYFSQPHQVSLKATTLTTQSIPISYGWNLVGNSTFGPAALNLPEGVFAYLLVDGVWQSILSGEQVPAGRGVLIGTPSTSSLRVTLKNQR